MSGRRPLLAANWKMNFRAGDAARYFDAFLANPPDVREREAVFFVPAPLLSETADALRGSGIAFGGQNVHWEERGAFTGETSAEMVAASGASHCLVGHSERRLLFGEDDAAVARKVRAVLRHSMMPVVCVGETLEERRAGKAHDRVVAQLEAALGDLDQDQARSIVLAYEPVWAIGTGETATPELAAEMHQLARETLRRLVGEGAASVVRILYGGSVTPENIDGLMAQPEIDGALVGGASLKHESFRRIVAFQPPASRPA